MILAIANMSESSLSPAPPDDPDEYENASQELLLPLPLVRMPVLSQDEPLPDSDSILFSKGLYSRTIFDNAPSRISFKCLQPHCKYTPSQLIKMQTTSNLWKHLKTQHPVIHAQYKKKHIQDGDTQPSSSTTATFFQPRKVSSHAPNSSKFRELLLSFIVSNNLPLRTSESLSFRQLVSHLNPTQLCSWTDDNWKRLATDILHS